MFKKYRNEVSRETLMFSLTIYDHVWPCTSSGLMALIFSLTTYDHVWPCTSSGLMSLILGFITFHVLRAGLRHLYWALCTSSDTMQFLLGFINFHILRAAFYQLPDFCIHIEIWISFTVSHESRQMKVLLDDRTSGVVVGLLVVHALLVIGGNRTMDVDRSVVHAPSLGKSMKRPQSSQWVAFVRVVFSQWVYVSWKRRT